MEGQASLPRLPPAEDLLGEQVAYYRARAGEYDRWFYRKGRFDRGEEATARWSAELEEVRAALAGVDLDGADVVELAAGTGIWSEPLAARAGHLTCVDASPEMLAENARRLGGQAERVTYVLADLFAWAPERRYEAAAFCFWISHVPDSLLDAFLAKVAAGLVEGGPVFFLDGLPDETSTAADHVLPAPGEEVMRRRLDDGREYRIVKRFRASGELESSCRRAGLAVEVHETATYFQFGLGRRRLAGDAAEKGRS